MSQTATQCPALILRANSAPDSSGASAYGKALAQAGGNELVCLPRSAETAVHVGLYNAPPYDLNVPALSVSRLSVPLTYSRITGALDGDRVRTYDAPRHSLYLTPAHAAAHWSKDRPSRHINIYFHASAFGGDMREEGHLDEAAAARINAGLERAFLGLRGIADELAAELQSPDAFAAEAVDCLARSLLVRLARMQARLSQSLSPLTLPMFQRVKDYVQASLSEKILVGDLAAVAGLSVNRFAHAFAHQTGQSPHQYVLTQRLTMAESLLARSRMSLAEIAAASGFASQQHLTNTMRARTGLTPGRYRVKANCGLQTAVVRR